MKAISVRQPWANLIATGKKTIETRKCPTDYRGDLLIVSSKEPKIKGLLSGYALCIVKLVNCRPMTKDDEEAAKVKLFRGVFAWVLEDIRPIKPFPVKGKSGFYEVDYP